MNNQRYGTKTIFSALTWIILAAGCGGRGPVGPQDAGVDQAVPVRPWVRPDQGPRPDCELTDRPRSREDLHHTFDLGLGDGPPLQGDLRPLSDQGFSDRPQNQGDLRPLSDQGLSDRPQSQGDLRVEPDLHAADSAAPDAFIAWSVQDPAGIPVSTAVDSQGGTRVAFGNDQFLVVWTDMRNGIYDIYGARVALDGTVLDPVGIPICTEAAYQQHVDVAFDGTNFLVVWEDKRNSSSQIYGARVSPQGVVLDPNSVLLSSGTGQLAYPAVAAGDSGYLVVWQNNQGTPTSSGDIYGAQVYAGDDLQSSAEIPISTSIRSEARPSLAFDGTNFLVAWNGSEAMSSMADDIYAARVSGGGVLLDTQPIIVTDALSWQLGTQVAATTSGFLVTWRHGPCCDFQTHGARVSSAGVLLDPDSLVFCSQDCGANAAAIASDGSEYLLVHESDFAEGDVKATRLSAEGEALGTPSFTISAVAKRQHLPVVAYGGGGFLVVWVDQRGIQSPLNSSDIYAARVGP